MKIPSAHEPLLSGQVYRHIATGHSCYDTRMSTNPPRRRYSHDERAKAVAAVAANNGSVHGTAKLLGVPETSLRQWVRGDRHPELLPLSEFYKRELAQRFEDLIPRLLDIVDAKMHEMSGYQAMLASAICVDKWLLLTAEPTEATRTRGESVRAREFGARYNSLHAGDAVMGLSEDALAEARKLLGELCADRSKEHERGSCGIDQLSKAGSRSGERMDSTASAKEKGERNAAEFDQ